MSKNKKETSQYITAEEREYNAVIYTDGSGLLEYKAWGYGFIGYTYDVNSDKPDKSLLKKLNPTNIGFVSKEMLLEDEIYKKARPVEIDKILYGYKTGYEDNTNNFAEASATYDVLERLYNSVEGGYKLKNIMIKTDSQMVVMVYVDMLNNPNFNPNKFAYPDLYSNIHNLLTRFKEKNIGVIVSHVYGHGSSVANHLADRLAFVGRNNHVNKKIKNEKVSNGCVVLASANDLTKEYNSTWTGPVLSLPFFRIYVPSMGCSGDTVSYNVMEYPKNGDDMGTRDPNIPFGSIQDTEKDKIIIDMLDSKVFDGFKDEYFHLMLENIKAPLTFLMMKLGMDVLTTKTKSVKLLGDTDLAILTEPAGLIRQQLDRYVKTDLALTSYNNFINNNKETTRCEIVDVTSKFYKENPNGEIICALSHKEDDFKITTTLGTETEHVVKFSSFLPRVNYFKSLEGRKFKSIKCYFLTILVSVTEVKDKKTYLYDDYFIVDGKDEDRRHLAVWCNFYSGRTLNIT